jgi:hypothetical protein
MTLDPVHFDGITRHARRIVGSIDEGDHRAFAETVWQEYLDPLVDEDGTVVLEPLDEQQCYEAAIEPAALQASPFPSHHGLDSGTINPTSFKNGLVLDVAQAAMAAEPSDLGLHRTRTIVTTVHTSDPVGFPEREEELDEGHTHNVLLKAPRVPRFEESVVHELSLYLAESSHARTHAEVVDDLLVLDGPVYPKGMLNWADRDPDLANLLYDEPKPRDVVENYLRLVERFDRKDVPLIGFVKNPATKAITRLLRDRGEEAPWVSDAALFTGLLERVEFVETVDEDGSTRPVRTRDTDVLTYTNWFRSRGGADRLLSADGDALGIERELSPDQYEVTFFVLYDPRDDLLYRIEAPYAITENEEARDSLTTFVVREVATQRGPPTAVAKADELARIGRGETDSLRDALAESFHTDRLRDYDSFRWSEEEE